MDEALQLHGSKAEFQAQLFSDFEEQPQLVEAAKVYVHTGKITSKDEALCEVIVENYLSGAFSIRKLAKRLKVGRETVRAVLRLAEASGKLGPLKERLSKKIGSTTELCLDAINDRIEDGTMPAQSLPIVLGILMDKKAALDGDANLRIEIVGRREVTAEDVLAEFEAMKKANVIDVQSGVLPSIAECSGQTGGQS